MVFPRIRDLGRTDMGWLGWIVPLRQKIERAIDAWLPEPEAALLIAITLGAKSTQLGDLTPVLISTGLIHVIAISGIKVALVAGTIYQLARRLGRLFLNLLVGLAALALYVLLTGATASGERSALMWALVFVAAYLGRPTVALVSLGVAAALMVAVEPTLMWDTGFLMSVTGTLAIVAFSGPLISRLRLLPAPWREAFCVSLAAQAGTMPVALAGFHTASVISPFANALVLPLLPALIVLGFLLAAVSSISPLAAAVGAVAYTLLHVMVVISREISMLPGVFRGVSLHPVTSLGYYAVVAALGLLPFDALDGLRLESGWVINASSHSLSDLGWCSPPPRSLCLPM